MSSSDSPDEIHLNFQFNSQVNLTVENERSLQQMAWAIEMSRGQFKLIFARCNYLKLRDRLMARLREIYPGEIRTIDLPVASQSLMEAIEEELGDDIPEVLVFLGLERLEELDRFWAVTDRNREEVRQRCPFPMVIWIDDRTLDRLMQHAPNFESFGTTKRFEIAPDELIEWVRQTADFQFDRMLEIGAERFVDFLGENAAAQMLSGGEFEFAQRDLTAGGNSSDIERDATLEADLEFLLGRGADPLAEEGRQHFQCSLALWQELENREREACLRYCLGVWWRNRAVRDRREYQTGCDRARQCFEECVAGFEAAGRLDLVAKFINALGDALQRLERWEALEVLGKRALALHQAQHQTNDNPFRRVRSLGFLARVALTKGDWQSARQLAREALEALPDGDGGDFSAELQAYRSSESLFLLAAAQRQLGEPQGSLSHLETALAQMQPEWEPQLYVGILEALRSGYYELGNYPQAFEYKQQRRSIEQQFGLRAFLGAGRLQARREAQLGEASERVPPKTIAPEIIASGRQPDVERLMARMADKHSQVTVLYGYSGVGKSSLVLGGLVPALKRKPIGFRDALPVVVRSYGDWLGELGRVLGEALGERKIAPTVPLESEAAILAQLRENEQRNRLTVLIFDQFEEFFFQHSRRDTRNPLFEFLGEALQVLSLKLVFSLRRDYLHHLLNRPGFDRIDDDILSRHVLYKIGNFSSEEAKVVVRQQTQRANFPVRPDLIDALVADLDAGYGKVRPIELQVVGAQLQEENITTLAAYRQRGPKKALVRRYLERVVEDCGREYRQVAELVLFLLTDEKKFRPTKTRSELAADLQKLGINTEKFPLPTSSISLLTASPRPRVPASSPSPISPLNWILTVCTGSGLVQEVPGKDALRYQLVHDYIASSIRKQHEPRVLERVQEERAQREKAEAKLGEAEAELDAVQQEREKAERELVAVEREREEAERVLALARTKAQQQVVAGSVILVATAVAAVGIGIYSTDKVADANQEREKAEAEAVEAGEEVSQAREDVRVAQDDLQSAQEEVRVTLRDLENTQEGLKIARNEKEEAEQEAQEAGERAETADREASRKIEEADVAVADAETRVSQAVERVEEAQTVLAVAQQERERVEEEAARNLENAQQQTEEAQQEQRIAAASAREAQKKVRAAEVTLAEAEAELARAQTGTRLERAGTYARQRFEFEQIESLLLAMRAGKELQSTLKNGFYPAYSPISSLNDILQKIRLKNVFNHQAWVTSAQFSPDGNRILTASGDNTARLWDLQGNQLKTFEHQARVYSARFSPEGNRILTAS
ncbi:MAG: hypothetical protein SWY16_26295, partial [Cyanobacteriota bacterium]|nr:hypothetical protein [Cyanobacteriota bacterium]